jgi:endonuclease/exonuclease/phosphatase family metal-dependent hydrolase
MLKQGRYSTEKVVQGHFFFFLTKQPPSLVRDQSISTMITDPYGDLFNSIQKYIDFRNSTTKIVVMSWNLFTPHSSFKTKPWLKRIHSIQRIVHLINPDVVSFQEVPNANAINSDSILSIERYFSNQYRIFKSVKAPQNANGLGFDNVIMIKMGKMALVSDHPNRLSIRTDVKSGFASAMYVSVKVVKTGEVFTFSAQHIKYRPQSSKEATFITQTQLASMNLELKASTNCIFMGDFNMSGDELKKHVSTAQNGVVVLDKNHKTLIKPVKKYVDIKKKDFVAFMNGLSASLYIPKEGFGPFVAKKIHENFIKKRTDLTDPQKNTILNELSQVFGRFKLAQQTKSLNFCSRRKVQKAYYEALNISNYVEHADVDHFVVKMVNQPTRKMTCRVLKPHKSTQIAYEKFSDHYPIVLAFESK